MTDRSNSFDTAQESPLLEPLLSNDTNDHEQDHDHVVEEEDVEQPSVCGESNASSCPLNTTITTITTTPAGNVNSDMEDDNNNHNNEPFSMRTELGELWLLGFPLAVSFFCRMAMASTDSAFVGHIDHGEYPPEVYLAAAVLADMCATVLVTPPLAFNQVLNALVGQAMGSGNHRMAGIWLQQSMVWLTITMLPFLVGFFYVEPMLLALDFDANVARVAGHYAKFNVVWPIPNGLYQCLRFYFQAQGLPRPAMYNNMIFLAVNGLLNWLFVFGGPFQYLMETHPLHWEGWGFVGAAISLSTSRTLQGVTYYCYMFVYRQHHLPTWPEAGWSLEHHTWARTKEFLAQSIPNMGTSLFQCAAGNATTVLLGRLGERAIAASSALSTVCMPWAGTLSATTCTMSGVRVGYHLGRGHAHAAHKTTWLVLHMITIATAMVALLFLLLQEWILDIATDDQHVLDVAATLIPAMLVGTYLNLIVGNITSGVFSGMGRPLIATILSFGFELPMSVGGVAIYILCFHSPTLLGVQWWQAIAGGLEAVVVLVILMRSNWNKCAEDAQQRQEARMESSSGTGDGDEALTAANTTEEESSSDEEDGDEQALRGVETQEGA